MFVDELKNIKIVAGKGGDGKKNRSAHGTPDGGDGGKGGDVLILGNKNYYDFRHLINKKEFKAENGKDGGKNQKTGQNGQDLIIEVPLTTKIYNENNDEICAITKDGEIYKLLTGGVGGLGNYYFRKHFQGYSKSTPGRPGEEGSFNFILELYSDIIFIGLPNSGKSTLLSKLTNADAKIGAYAFTTINPQQGRMDDITLLDLPGLIEQTYQGKGVGTKFVKHTKSAKILAHIISLENEVSDSYHTIKNEIKKIKNGLDEKKEIIVLTKKDLCDENKLNNDIAFFTKLGIECIAVSAESDDDMKLLEAFFKQAYESIKRSE